MASPSSVGGGPNGAAGSFGTRGPIALPLDVPELLVSSGEEGEIVRRTILGSGVRVITEHVPAARSTAIGFWVQVGSRDENPVRYGSTHFLEHLLFKGTRRRTALDIATAFDAVGGEQNALTGKESTCYYARVRSADVPMAVDVLADMVVGSVLDAGETERERGVILEELAMAADDPEDVVMEEFSRAVFGEHALGRPIGGTPESIGAVSRDEVWSHYRQFYRPGSVVVAAAGGVDHDAFVGLVDDALSHLGWDGHGAPLPRRLARARIDDAGPARVVARDLEQEHVVVGFPGLRRDDPAKYTSSVLHSVLGAGMSSRLFQQVRERRGLAYSVYSFGEGYSDAGAFGMYVGCAPRNAGEATQVMLEQLEGLAADGPSDEELARAKGQLVGSSTLALDDVLSRMTRLGRSELGAAGFVPLDAAVAAVETVSAEDVATLAAEIASGSLAIAAVGPLGDEAVARIVTARG